MFKSLLSNRVLGHALRHEENAIENDTHLHHDEEKRGAVDGHTSADSPEAFTPMLRHVPSVPKAMSTLGNEGSIVQPQQHTNNSSGTNTSKKSLATLAGAMATIKASSNNYTRDRTAA